MLFKTKDALNDNEIFYCELPRKFRYEITQQEHYFQRYNTTLLANVASPPKQREAISVKLANHYGAAVESVDDLKFDTDNILIQEGTKHLFYEQDGEVHHILFLHNGWIIDKKNQTVETL